MNEKQVYSLTKRMGPQQGGVIVDSSFEKRLKAFDPDLKLMFDQNSKRWHVLTWRSIDSSWQILIKAEDDQGNPKPLGDWIFNRLFVYRHNWECSKKGQDPIEYLAQCNRDKIEKRMSEENKYKLKYDVNQWRRAWRAYQDMPESDVTAGYPKTILNEWRSKNENTENSKDLQSNS